MQNPATRLGQLTKDASMKSNSALLVFAAAWFDIVAVPVQVARDYWNGPIRTQQAQTSLIIREPVKFKLQFRFYYASR